MIPHSVFFISTTYQHHTCTELTHTRTPATHTCSPLSALSRPAARLLSSQPISHRSVVWIRQCSSHWLNMKQIARLAAMLWESCFFVFFVAESDILYSIVYSGQGCLISVMLHQVRGFISQMHAFFSNQISRIRSVCIISYFFHTRGISCCTKYWKLNCCPMTFCQSLCLSGSPFSSHSHSLLLIQTVHAKYVKNCFFLRLSLHSVRYYFCLCRCSLFSVSLCHSFLPDAAVMAREESAIGPQYFSED